MSSPDVNVGKVPLAELITLLRCPATGESLRREGDRLVSEGGRHSYPIVRGQVPFVVTETELTPLFLDELFRYRRFFRLYREGAYEPDRTSIKLEQVKQGSRLYRHYFDSIVSKVDLSSSPLVLDTGAGMMETSKELSRRGARVVATDFSPEEVFNPRIYSFFDETGYDWNTFSVADGQRPLTPEEIDFARVLAPSEELPFKDGIFDIVFTRSSLHHVKDLPQTLHEMHRVLKPGGRLVIAGECIRPLWEPEHIYLEEIIDFQEGIDEQMRVWSEYSSALHRAGFVNVLAQPLLAGSGRYGTRLWNRLGIADPFKRLEGKELGTLGQMGLHAMGCVIGFTALKGPSKPPPPQKPIATSSVSLADALADFKARQDELGLLALQAHRDLPGEYSAETIAQPACVGFGPFRDGRRRIFRQGYLSFGSIPRDGSFQLRITVENPESGEVSLRVFPSGNVEQYRFGRGENTLQILLPEGFSGGCCELHFEFPEGIRANFHSVVSKPHGPGTNS